MRSSTRYSKLRNMMGGMFHQDWKDFHKSDGDALTDFARKSPSQVVQDVISEITDFLRENSNPLRANELFMEDWGVEPPYSEPRDSLKWLAIAARSLSRDNLKPKSLPSRRTQRPSGQTASYPGLYLLMCQFDEYWRDVFGTEMKVLRHAKVVFSERDVCACVRDISRLLQLPRDSDIDHILKHGLKGFPPYHSASDARGWLKQVIAVLNRK